MRFLLLILLFVNLNAQVSVDRMIGQMLLVGFSGQNVEDKWIKQISRDISYGKVGSVILKERNIKNPNQLKALTKKIKDIPVSIPVLIAINEADRLLSSNKGFKNISSIYNTSSKTLEKASKTYANLASNLKQFHINLSLAPSVNLANNGSFVQQNKLSFSKSEDIVNLYANAFIDEFSKFKIITSIKHFPGLGSVKFDFHKNKTDITNSWKIKELKPYYNITKTNRAKSIIVSHSYLKQFDKKYPTSLSKNIIQGLLREKIGFDGVVISDDLLVNALDGFSLEERVILAINAGVDLLFVSDYFVKNSNYVKIITDIIKKAVNENKISKETLANSYERILKLKKEL